MCCSWMRSVTLFSARLQTRRYSLLTFGIATTVKWVFDFGWTPYMRVENKKRNKFSKILIKRILFNRRSFLLLQQQLRSQNYHRNYQPRMERVIRHLKWWHSVFLPHAGTSTGRDQPMSRHRTGENTNTKRNSASGWMMIPFPCKWLTQNNKRRSLNMKAELFRNWLFPSDSISFYTGYFKLLLGGYAWEWQAC